MSRAHARKLDWAPWSDSRAISHRALPNIGDETSRNENENLGGLN